MSIDQIVTILAFEKRGVRVSNACDLLEGYVEVGCRAFGLLVSLFFQSHLVRALHARLHINRSFSFLHLNGAAIKTENKLFVVDSLARAIVELF